ncbi:glycoside hydrolase family 31 protein [Clostridium sp. DL1XJH146]
MSYKVNEKLMVFMPKVRFTVLTDRLIRFEYSEDNTFENRASQTFWHRDLEVPRFEILKKESSLEIITSYLHLKYESTENIFSKQTLSIYVKATDKTYKFGDQSKEANLGGTARTLDNTNGHVDLEQGLMSKDGWVIVDDSRSLVFGDNGWLEPRKTGRQDFYFFGYGLDFKDCLADFCRVAGSVPMIPRWALGNWWSRFHCYTDTELKELMTDFKEHDIPLSVCIVDMDWHVVENPYSNGWTGYTWNKKYFPEPEAFTRWIHQQGLKIALNVHPADGVHAHEDAYENMAKRMGVDPATKEGIAFDCASPTFMKAYFEELHHPLENQGVDFWWIDWQQGEETKIPGLDPLYWLNHMHFYDLGRNKIKRNLIFSRWGGLGNHRYPIGFSGDTEISWESLQIQPSFTAKAANVGYSWWSHDIGGHMLGIEDEELYTRWVQYGVFSPILRLHSTNNVFIDRRPWEKNAEVYRITKDAMQLRHQLIPYIYSMAWRNHKKHVPLVTPMYYESPKDNKAYYNENQYYFGSELVAAPFIEPKNEEIGLSINNIWLPQGDWYNFFTGEQYKGGKSYYNYGELDEIPVYAKAGAIVPMDKDRGWKKADNPEQLLLRIFAGANNTFELYEDDGESTNFEDGHYAITKIIQKYDNREMLVVIEKPQGDLSIIPQNRQVTFQVNGIVNPDKVILKINGKELETSYKYENSKACLTVSTASIPSGSEIYLTIKTEQSELIEERDYKRERAIKLLRNLPINTQLKEKIYKRIDEFIDDPSHVESIRGDLKITTFLVLKDTFISE